jgi:hypothetical protein
MPIKLTTEQFIKKAISIHGNKFDYSEVEYQTSIIPVKIFCKAHKKSFWKKPNKHLASKQGCQDCGKEKSREATERSRSSTEEFICKAQNKHKDKFDYSKSIYTTADDKIEIICNECGLDFWQIVNNHLRGWGCPFCAGKFLTTELFIKTAKKTHGDKYDYTFVIYKTNKDKVIVSCRACGKQFPQLPSNHLQGQGCPWCSRSPIIDTDIFIERAIGIHGDKYNYSLVHYIASKVDVDIICKTCSITFPQQPMVHLSGSGCPKCPSRTSRSEKNWLDYLGIPEKYRGSILKIDGKTIKTDAYNPTTNTVYEFYGDYWHGNPEKFDHNKTHRHTGKTFGELYHNTIKREELLKQAGYNLITIWESDWKRQFKKVA